MRRPHRLSSGYAENPGYNQWSNLGGIATVFEKAESRLEPGSIPYDVRQGWQWSSLWLQNLALASIGLLGTPKANKRLESVWVNPIITMDDKGGNGSGFFIPADDKTSHHITSHHIKITPHHTISYHIISYHHTCRIRVFKGLLNPCDQ